jgi:hypothetical protein
LDIHRFWFRDSRDRLGDAFWLDFTAPHHLDVDVTVTIARTNTHVLHIGARLPRPGSLALEAQQGNLDADLGTFALHDTPSVHSVHDNYPFVVEDGGRLAPMAVELVDRLAILVAARRFLGMGVVDSRLLRCDSYVCMQHSVRRYTFVHFRRFWGDMRRKFMQYLSTVLFMLRFGFLSSRRFAGG